MKTKLISRCDGVTCWDIIDRDGKSIGFMESEVEDGNFLTTSRSRRWVVGGYRIELDDGREAFFATEDYGTALLARAAAIKFLRETEATNDRN